MDYLALAPAAFLVVLALVCAIGTPYRGAPRRQDVAQTPPTQAPHLQRATASASPRGLPPAEQRYIIKDGKLVPVSS